MLLLILMTAFALRLGLRLWSGETNFWANGYSSYFDMAENVAAGKGFCLSGTECSRWPPVYPAMLALTVPRERAFIRIVVMQSVLGAGTAACAYLIAAFFFGRQTGLIAAFLTAIYPYYLVHDTALQETGTFTFFTALAVYAILRARSSQSVWPAAAAGLALGVAVLTRASLAPYAFAVLPAYWVSSARDRAVRKASAFLLGVAILIAPWLVKTWQTTGIATLTTQSGRFLWVAQNASTFAYYPAASIDLSEDAAHAALTPEDLHELSRIDSDPRARNAWYQHRAFSWMQSHPLDVVWDALRKVSAAFSWRLNPAHNPLENAVYMLSYLPLSLCAVAGLFLTASRWREMLPLYLLVVCFIAVTAVFWAHTSHRTYLDVYGIVFASYVLSTRGTPPLRHLWPSRKGGPE